MENANTSTTQTPGGIVSSVKQRATAQLDTQKGRATDGLSALAQAARQTTQQLRSDQHDTLADYVDKAVQQLDRFTNSIRNKDVNELLRDAQQLARRQPALFIGGSFLAGMLAARFLKSSQQNDGEVRQYASADYPATVPADYSAATGATATPYGAEGRTSTTRSRGRSKSESPSSERF